VEVRNSEFAGDSEVGLPAMAGSASVRTERE
jgi:hypothetical protein